VTTTVLAYFPSPTQGVWYLGPVPIRAYALCIIAGIIVALMIGDRRWAARGGERGVVYDVALWAVPFGLIGGRLYHLATDWRTYFGQNGAGLGAAMRIWEGGLGIWGAVAFGAVGAWIACRRRGIPLPAFGDAIAPGIVLAQAIGRLGNYFNQELYGRETTVPWGMEIFYRRDASGAVDVHSLDGVSTGQVAAVVHPTFLYELLWNVLVFLVLIYVDRKFRIGHGRLFALYVALYSVGRFGVELLRDDTATLVAGIRINVFTATFVLIGAVVYILLAPKGREDPATLRGTEASGTLEAPEESPAEEFAEDLAEELVAVAAGSGVVAAATVAREHESEDAAAVGDTAEDRDPPTTEDDAQPAAEDSAAEDSVDADSGFVAQVEAEEMAVEAELEEQLTQAEETGESEPAEPGVDEAAHDEQSAVDETAADETPADETAADETPADDTAPDEGAAGAPADDDVEQATVVSETPVAPDGDAPAEAVTELLDDESGEPLSAAPVTDADGQGEEPGFGTTLRRLLWGVRSKD